VARAERPLDEGPAELLGFAADLRRLRREAGGPAYRRLSERAHYSAAALAAAASGRRLPSLDVTMAYVRACGGDAAAWERRWRALAALLAPGDGLPGPGPGGGTEPDGTAPYVGLASFQPADADRFFGREELVTNLVHRVGRHRFVAIFGASGSGKSSVLRAGLIPRWTAPVAMFTPGPHPLEECALRLAALDLAGLRGAGPRDLHDELAGDPRGLHWVARRGLLGQPDGSDLLLVVDQFEEVYTLCQDPDERARFIGALVGAAAAQNSRCRVVIGTRADFYQHCTAHPDLVRALDEAQLAVGPMSLDELRQAITRPALRQHLTLEGALLAELVASAHGRVGVLPLLSHALLETWRRRRGNTLTLAGFQAAGGIDGALANTAETAYHALSAQRRHTARDLLTRLAALGDGTQETKRQLRRDDVDLADPDVRAVVEHLVAARLVLVDRDRIEITHEILIRCWPRLRRWLTEDRDLVSFHHELAGAARQWAELGRDGAALLRGVRLAAANDWIAGGRIALTPRERDFVAASSALQDAERAAARRQSRRLRRLIAVLTALLLLAAGATGYAAEARQAAARQRDIATAQNVAAAAARLRVTRPALANQLLLAAYRLAPERTERGALLSAFALPYATVLDAPEALAGLATGGRTLVTAGAGGGVRVLDIADPHRPRPVAPDPGPAPEAVVLAFTPDGRLLAGGDRGGAIRLWDTTDPGRWRRLPGAAGTGAALHALALRPDGGALAAAGDGPDVRVWELAGAGPPRPAAVLRGPGAPVRAVAFAPDGRTLASAGDDGAVRLWSTGGAPPARPRLVLPAGTALAAVAFSPDGRWLAAAGGGHDVLLWDLVATAPRPARTSLTGHTDAVTSLAFSPDGRVLASAGLDATVRLWDLRDAAHPGPVQTLGGHVDTVTAVAFDRTGQTLISASRDRTVRLWDVPGGVLAAHDSSVYSVAESPDGETVATASYDRTVRLWDVRDADHPRAAATLRGHAGPVNSVAFSPDGRSLASGGDDGTARLWDVSRRGPPGQLSVPVHGAAPVHAVAFGRPGTLAVGTGTTVALWDTGDPARPARLATVTGGREAVWSVALSPDGTLLAAGDGAGTVSLWSLADRTRPEPLGTLAGHTDRVRSVAFSPDGRLLATAGEDQTALVWEVTRPRRPVLLAAVTGDTDGVESVAFGPGGHLMATASSDRVVRLWDVTQPRRIRELASLTGHPKPVDAVTFSRDGRYLLTGSEDWTALVWRTDPEDVARRICATAYPRIGPREWAGYFPGIRYRPPCPDR
jgi:WD40 repeat protein